MMSLSARSDRWFIGGVVLLALRRDLRARRPVGRRGTDRTAGQHRGTHHQRPRRAGPGAVRLAGIVDGRRALVCLSLGSLRRQWGRPDGSDCTSIAGATGTRHTVAGADVGFRLRIRVTATNSEGSQTVASDPTAVVVGPPVNTSLPVVSGNPLVDSTVTVSNGSWSGRQPISFSYAMGSLQLRRR